MAEWHITPMSDDGLVVVVCRDVGSWWRGDAGLLGRWLCNNYQYE